MKLNLFKYYRPKYEKKDNLAFFEKGQIYFQQPVKFNDPWDCKAPKISIPRQMSFLKEFHFYITQQYGVAFSNDEWERTKKLKRQPMKEKYKKLFEEALENIRKKIGVFSLSFIPDSELMWAHYAESHTGYMLQFEIVLEDYLINPLLSDTGIPIPVIYKKKRPNLNIASYYSNSEQHIYNLIRYKSEAWKYEYELRLMNETQFGFIDTPKSWLKSITVGLAVDNKLKEKMQTIGHELNIPVFFASIHKEIYQIVIPGLNINGIDGKKGYEELINSNLLELK